MASRTSVHRRFGDLAGASRAGLQDIPRQPGILFIFLAPRSCMGARMLNQRIRHPAFAFDAADSRASGNLRPPWPSFVCRSLKILCRSPTGQTSGLPGSVRRTRAGSVTMVFSFCRTTGSGSVSRMVLPYDFDILRPSVPGSLGAGVSKGCGSGKTSCPLAGLEAG